MIDKELLKLTQVQREQWAMEHYKKHETELTLDEMKKLDKAYPTWVPVITKYGDQLEVTMGGTSVRDYNSKKIIKIYYTNDSKGNPSYPIIFIKDGKNQKYYRYAVHRLVAQAFCDNPDNKPEVNHIDGHKNNNAYWNLEWCTRSENELHAYRTGLSISLKGEEHPAAKYTNDQIRQVCELLKTRPNLSSTDIKKITGVDDGVVNDIYRGIIWKSISKDYTPFPPRETTSVYTPDQMELVCELLRDFPEWSLEKIGETAGVLYYTVRDVYEGKVWKDISRNYDFPPRNSRPKGGRVWNTKYSEDQIREACKMLEQRSDLSFSEIGNATGLPYSTVRDIYSGSYWAHVSNEYEFKSRIVNNVGENNSQAKYNDEVAEQVCQLLDQVYLGQIKMSHKEIADKIGVAVTFVNDICNGRARKNVSKNYQFYKDKGGSSRCTRNYNIIHAYKTRLRREQPKGEDSPVSKYTDDTVRKICEYLSKPEYRVWSSGDIANAVGVPRSFVDNIYERKRRTNVSKDYTFLPRDTKAIYGHRGENNVLNKYKDEDVERLCCELDNIWKTDGKLSKTVKLELAEKFEFPATFVKAVWQGETRTYISENHPFYKEKYNERFSR